MAKAKQKREPDSFYFSLRNWFEGKSKAVRPGFMPRLDAVGFEVKIPFGDESRAVRLALDVRSVVALGRLFDGILPDDHGHAFWHLRSRNGKPCTDCSAELRAKLDPFNPRHKVQEPIDPEPDVPVIPPKSTPKKRRHR